MKITVVGLGVTGTSLALALQAAHEAIEITGHDREPERSARAKRLGAIDHSEWNLLAACEKSGLIVLDLPLQELWQTLPTIGEVAAPDAVIVDLAPVKRPVLEFVREALAHPGRFVGGHLLRSPSALREDEPSTEWVHGATFYLVALPETSTTALDVATSLAIAAGAQPRFIDAAEHDGLVAATCQLPAVAAAGMVGAVATDAGCQERSRASAGVLVALRAALAEGADVEALLSNDANLLYWIDRYVVELQRLRGLVVDGDRQAVAEALTKAADTLARWSEGDSQAKPTSPRRSEGGWRELLVGGLGKDRPSRR